MANQITSALGQIENALSQKYSYKRKGLIAKELGVAKERLENGQTYRLKRAQWGGKFGNYYHLIALNSNGEYTFVEGFNPDKYLN